MTLHNHQLSDSSCRMDDASRALTPSQAMDLLSLGAAGPARPVDLVIERLARTNGAASIAKAVAAAFDLEIDQILDDRASLVSLRSAKDQAKRQIEANGNDVVAVALYFLAVSAGLAYHNVNLSSRAGDELLEAIIDLGEASPAPWRAMFRTAAIHLADLSSASN